jgi:hypothetical protein
VRSFLNCRIHKEVKFIPKKAMKANPSASIFDSMKMCKEGYGRKIHVV